MPVPNVIQKDKMIQWYHELQNTAVVYSEIQYKQFCTKHNTELKSLEESDLPADKVNVRVQEIKDALKQADEVIDFIRGLNDKAFKVTNQTMFVLSGITGYYGQKVPNSKKMQVYFNGSDFNQTEIYSKLKLAYSGLINGQFEEYRDFVTKLKKILTDFGQKYMTNEDYKVFKKVSITDTTVREITSAVYQKYQYNNRTGKIDKKLNNEYVVVTAVILGLLRDCYGMKSQYEIKQMIKQAEKSEDIQRFDI